VRHERAQLKKVYAAFNTRDLGALAPMLHPDVEWPNGLEGGTVRGRQAVLDYFARQFETMNPDARLIGVRFEPPARLVADLQYAVKDLRGQVWSDTRATLAYDFRDGLLAGMVVIGGF